MSFDYTTLITDRTAADVARVQTLAAKNYAAMTDAEKAEWDADMKGAYNASDLNRVTAALEDLKSQLNGYGYAVPGYYSLKTDWDEADEPTENEMAIYIGNVAAVRRVLAVLSTTPTTPASMANLTVDKANDIEKILLDISVQLDILPTTYIPAGEAICGGDNL